jgi:hypothetical protein
MVIHRDRWPAVLTGEQEDILMRAGFLYDSDLGVLVNQKLRKVLAVEAAAERGVSELRSFASKRRARRTEIVFDGEAARDFRDSVKRRYRWA